jgi:sulfatase maturation enzyme AslB (radical SAM superfamily)
VEKDVKGNILEKEMTKAKWINAVNKTLEKWSERERSYIYIKPAFDCPLCVLAGYPYFCCNRCIVVAVFGDICCNDRAPVSDYKKYATAEELKEAASWAITSLCLLRAILEDEDEHEDRRTVR